MISIEELKKQIEQLNTKPSFLPKFWSWYEGKKQKKQHGIDEKGQQEFCKLSQRYLDEQPFTISLEEIYIAFGIPESTYFWWVENIDVLKENNQLLCRRLGIRREKLAAFDLANERTMHFTQGHYSKIWDDAEEKRATRDEKIASKSGFKVIELEKAEETEEVRLKKEADERRNKATSAIENTTK